MSLIAVLVPLAIAVSVSLTKKGAEKMRGPNGTLVGIEDAETVFTDHELLITTLKEHGLPVEVESENRIYVRTDGYELTYERAKFGDAFLLTAVGKDGGTLEVDIDCLEREYRSNVQSYTYERLIRNLSENGMTVDSEELTDDDAIVLTVNLH